MSRHLIPLLLGVSLAGLACRGAPPEKKTPAARAPAAAQAPARQDPAADGPSTDAPAKGGGALPFVLMIVMDTVRADHLSMCGYDRPTSPYLETLSKRSRVAFSCEAHSPGPWTVPSHASYFTGLTVPEHGSDTMGIQFSSTIPTIGEIMEKRGYQSVLFSANPTLSANSGLQRGFSIIDVARTLTDVRGDEVRHRLRRLLNEVDGDKPMFLVVNLIDAHDPYPRVPPDIGWVPQQDTMVYDVHDRERDTPYHQYFRGELTAEEEARYQERARNGYDYGVSLADQNVEATLRVLRQDGWLTHGFRMVITADHGEYLGEHHLLRHGSFLWEPVTRVPFLYFDSAAEAPITLPTPFSSLNAFSLLTEGRLPSTPIPVASYANEREYDIKKGADVVALWSSPTDKILWQTDRYFRVDLAADPAERQELDLPAGYPMRADLERMVAAHRAHLDEMRSKAVNPALRDELRALGYIESPEPGAQAAP
jgi:hypothetical protein